MIFIQMTEQLKSLSNLLLLLNDRQYNQKIVFLGNASIGGHTYSAVNGNDRSGNKA